MDKKIPNFTRLLARLEQWCKLYPGEAHMLGPVTRREVAAAAEKVHIDSPNVMFFLHCGNCGVEDIASLADAILHHRAGDPSFLCNACSEAYEARAKRMLREHLTAPAHLRSAWSRIRASGGRGILQGKRTQPPKAGDPVRN